MHSAFVPVIYSLLCLSPTHAIVPWIPLLLSIQVASLDHPFSLLSWITLISKYAVWSPIPKYCSLTSHLLLVTNLICWSLQQNLQKSYLPQMSLHSLICQSPFFLFLWRINSPHCNYFCQSRQPPPSCQIQGTISGPHLVWCTSNIWCTWSLPSWNLIWCL